MTYNRLPQYILNMVYSKVVLLHSISEQKCIVSAIVKKKKKISNSIQNSSTGEKT